MTAIAILLFLLVAVPIAEIVVLIEVGGLIGTVPTIALIILTALAGTALIRLQGLGVVAELRRAADRGAPPVMPLIDGLFLLVAGALLLTPGFLTDAVGFACLVPPLRRLLAAALWRRIVARGHWTAVSAGPAGTRRGPDIEGEFVEVTPEPGRPREDGGGSPWLDDGSDHGPPSSDERDQ